MLKRKLTSYIFLAAILIIATLLRFWGLDFQSLWVDELHTMIESAPYKSWTELFDYLSLTDQHPPLHFVIEKVCFEWFGHTAYVARVPSVVAGVLSIYFLFLLGKEILDRELGFILSIVGTFNYYHILYSQEARGYMFAFMFCTLSIVFLIRLLKNPNFKIALFFALAALGMLYSHYFSLFVVVAQAFLCFLILIQSKKPKIHFKYFLISFAIIGVAYAPWLPFLLNMTGIKSFWIEKIPTSFLVDYFGEYFGNAPIVISFATMSLIFFLIKAFMNSTEKETIKNPLSLALLTIIVIFFVSIGIPYLRSILVIPMLQCRYTIFVLPLVFLALAYGIRLIQWNIMRYTFLILFVSFSYSALTYDKEYYSKVSKTDYRAIAQFLKEEVEFDQPIINETASFQFDYYLRKYGLTNQQIGKNKEEIIKGFLHNTEHPEIADGFWLLRSHGEDELEEIDRFKETFCKVMQLNRFDATLCYYINQQTERRSLRIESNHFKENGSAMTFGNEWALWNGLTETKRIALDSGSYELRLIARGTPADHEFPKVEIKLNNMSLGVVEVGNSNFLNTMLFTLSEPFEGSISIDLINDFVDKNGKDRNVFIDKIDILKK
ncbi:MAG: glycosyltransferase family 39 protein [Flavobacteriales bacterium]|nr:glycosyltransferase family 39 protein [Flavobacteriales bacterium]